MEKWRFFKRTYCGPLGNLTIPISSYLKRFKQQRLSKSSIKSAKENANKGVDKIRFC